MCVCVCACMWLCVCVCVVCVHVLFFNHTLHTRAILDLHDYKNIDNINTLTVCKQIACDN